MANNIIKGLVAFLMVSGFCLQVKAQTILTDTIGRDYVITSPGVYQVSGTVVGNIKVEPSTSGDITIEGIGENPTLQGVPWGGNAIRSYSHYQGAAIGGTLTWRNLTVKGDGHNAMEGYGSTPKVFENIHVINYARTESGKSYDDVGSINGGENSIIRDCYLETGDDAAKLTEKNSRCYNTRIRLTKNGAAIQLGWKNRFGGPDHIADHIEIRGQLIPNIKDQDNESENPGRCIIAGIVQNDASNVQLTNLDIDVTNYKNLIKFLVQDGATVNPILKDVYIQGTATDRSIMNVDVMKCVSIVAKPGSKIRNMVIDLGDKIADPLYHYIKGDVDVKFIKSDGSAVEYVGGVLQTATGVKSLQADGSLKVYPNPFHNFLRVSGEAAVIQLVGINGNILKEIENKNKGVTTIETSALATGVYYIRTGNNVKRIIKQ